MGHIIKIQVGCYVSTLVGRGKGRKRLGKGRLAVSLEVIRKPCEHGRGRARGMSNPQKVEGAKNFQKNCPNSL